MNLRFLPLAVVLTTAIHAAVITQDFILPTTAVGFSGGFNLNQFDPALGTLDSVSWGLSVNVSGSITASNPSEFSENAAVTISADVTVSGNGDSLPASPLGSNSATVLGLSSELISATGSANNSTSVATPSSYTGTGTVGFSYGATDTSFLAGNVFEDARSVEADFIFTLTYDYTPVPEPAVAAALAGSALVAFGLVRRWRANR